MDVHEAIWPDRRQRRCAILAVLTEPSRLETLPGRPEVGVHGTARHPKGVLGPIGEGQVDLIGPSRVGLIGIKEKVGRARRGPWTDH